MYMRIEVINDRARYRRQNDIKIIGNGNRRNEKSAVEMSESEARIGAERLANFGGWPWRREA
jgi:hypothetical protein